MKKTVLITGVSRPSGIGYTLAKTFAQLNYKVFIHGYSPYDQSIGYTDAMINATSVVAKELQADGYDVIALKQSNLAEQNIPQEIITEVLTYTDKLDNLVLNHAYSTYSPLGEWHADDIDKHFNINVRASMLLIQEFNKQNFTIEQNAAITLFTSGQYLGPMVGEIPYAVSKDAIIGICKQLTHILAEKHIRINCVNPGPNDTGYATGSDYDNVAKMFPSGRWGEPSDVAKLVKFLHSDDSSWITAQVIASEGGFNRYK